MCIRPHPADCIRLWRFDVVATAKQLAEIHDAVWNECPDDGEPSLGDSLFPGALHYARVHDGLSLRLISAMQHLYFIIAAPAVFLPFGSALIRLRFVWLGWTAVGLGAVFASVGCLTILTQVLPNPVTILGALQAIWWLTAALTVCRSKDETACTTLAALIFEYSERTFYAISHLDACCHCATHLFSLNTG